MKILFSLLFPAQFLSFRTNWKEAWSYKSFRLQAVTTFSVLIGIAIFIPSFFSYIQSVNGHRINDMVLNILPVRDMSLYIFLLIYPVILLSVINLSTQPFLLLKCLQAYCLLVLIRVLTMYLVPLDPESSIINLEDPFVGRLFYNGSVITKDLFFSGHVSTMFLLFLTIPFCPLKTIFITATLLVAVFILMQHVHYTVDVIAAPLFSWICYKMVLLESKVLKSFEY